jgi:hypothetical protein
VAGGALPGAAATLMDALFGVQAHNIGCAYSGALHVHTVVLPFQTLTLGAT